VSQTQSQLPGSEPLETTDGKRADTASAAPRKGIGVYERPAQPFLTRPIVLIVLILVMLAISYFAFRAIF
jgi:hypothetical protein